MMMKRRKGVSCLAQRWSNKKRPSRLPMTSECHDTLLTSPSKWSHSANKSKLCSLCQNQAARPRDPCCALLHQNSTPRPLSSTVTAKTDLACGTSKPPYRRKAPPSRYCVVLGAYLDASPQALERGARLPPSQARVFLVRPASRRSGGGHEEKETTWYRHCRHLINTYPFGEAVKLGRPVNPKSPKISLS